MTYWFLENWTVSGPLYLPQLRAALLYGTGVKVELQKIGGWTCVVKKLVQGVNITPLYEKRRKKCLERWMVAGNEGVRRTKRREGDVMMVGYCFTTLS